MPLQNSVNNQILSPTFRAANSFPSWRKALANVRTKAGNARVLCVGDSTTWGYPTGPQASYPQRLANIATTASTPVAVGLAIPNGTDGRWSLGSGWSSSAIGYGAGGQAAFASAGGGALVFTPGIACDSFYVYYLGGTGFGTTLGSFAATASGGTTVNTNCNTGSQNAYRVLVQAPSVSASNSVSITATGNIWILGVEPFLSGTPQVLIGNAGVNGMKSSDWNNGQAGGGLSLISAAAPDLTIISLGINDAAYAVATSTYSSNMQAIITAAQATGDVVLSSFPPTLGSPFSTYEPLYIPVLQSLAQANGCVFLDIFARFGQTYQASFMTDSYHPTPQGYADIAQAVWSLLFANL